MPRSFSFDRYYKLYSLFIIQLMEEFSFASYKGNFDLKGEEKAELKKKYFKNFLKSQMKRFSSLIISNAITIQKNKAYFKIFQLSLQRPSSERTEEDDLAIAKILIQQNIFPEFKNDLNVVKIFSKNLVIKTYKTGEWLFAPNQKDENLYKILKGSTAIKNKQDVIIDTKGKGQFIQTIEKFKLIKDYYVECKQNSYFLMINYASYQEAMKLHIQNKIIIKMLTNTPLFNHFKRRELAYLIELSLQKQMQSKDFLFRQNDRNNEELYFIVQGQIIILKNNEEKHHQVCYLNDGTIIGQEILFNQNLRGYSACVNSSVAQIITISLANIQKMTSHFELPEEIIKKDDYRSFLERRKMHYVDKLKQDKNTITIYKSLVIPKKQLQGKKLQLSKILKSVQNISKKLESQEKVLSKRNKLYIKENTIISSEFPLFSRRDFPEYKHLIKKFQIQQMKAKQQSCRLPNLH